MLPRRLAVLSALAAAVALLLGSPASARPAPLLVSVWAGVPVRVQIAISPRQTMPCDSADNTVVFDDWVDPELGLVLDVGAGPLCVVHTYDDFPGANWGRPQLWIRRYDRPLRIRLDARAQ